MSPIHTVVLVPFTSLSEGSSAFWLCAAVEDRRLMSAMEVNLTKKL